MLANAVIWRDANDKNMFHVGVRSKAPTVGSWLGKAYVSYWFTVSHDFLWDMFGQKRADEFKDSLTTTPVDIVLSIRLPQDEEEVAPAERAGLGVDRG